MPGWHFLGMKNHHAYEQDQENFRKATTWLVFDLPRLYRVFRGNIFFNKILFAYSEAENLFPIAGKNRIIFFLTSLFRFRWGDAFDTPYNIHDHF